MADKKNIKRDLSVRIDSFDQDGGVTFYILQIEDRISKEVWQTKARFSKLHDIFDELSQQLDTNKLPKFPKKKWFGSNEPNFISQRQKELEIFFNNVLKYNNIDELDCLKKFLITNATVIKKKAQEDGKNQQQQPGQKNGQQGNQGQIAPNPQKKDPSQKGDSQQLQDGQKKLNQENSGQSNGLEKSQGLGQSNSGGHSSQNNQANQENPQQINQPINNENTYNGIHIPNQANKLQQMEKIVDITINQYVSLCDNFEPPMEYHVSEKQQMYENIKIDYKNNYIQNFMTLPKGKHSNAIEIHNPSFPASSPQFIQNMETFASIIDNVLSKPQLMADPSEIVHKLQL